MQGDFSRWTFDARKDYRSVLLQQGRVLLDADWNEQTELTRYHDETRTLDMIGRAGGPADHAGFGIIDSAGQVPSGVGWTSLQITLGRYYVDGILCEARLPEGAAGPGIALSDQPYLAAIGTNPGLPEPEAEGRYALYLDVWTHHVTADEAPTLRESALGGPDTTTRARTVWQVRVVEITDEQQCSDLHDPNWLAVTPGTLTPSLNDTPPDADPCLISTSGGYTRLENQLYRVQIHDTEGGTPRYLWSRENGSVVAGLVDIGPPTAPGMNPLTVDRVGRDEELSIREGDTVEVTSTDWQLRGLPGFLATAGAPDGLVLPVKWSDTAPADLEALGWAPIVRCWGGPSLLADTTVHELEDGITVSFDGGPFRTGDYWLIPARTVRLDYGLTALSGTLDWPSDTNGPVPAMPLGPVHHTTPLAVFIKDTSGWTRVSDCRRVTPPLNQLIAIDLIGGDGQEAPPGVELPKPIRVAVRNGGLPVVGAMVHFTAKAPATVHDGTVTGTVLPTEITTATAADGVAEVHWTLDKDGDSTQILVAQRLDDHDNGVDVQVIVTGRLSRDTGGGRTPGIHVIRAVLRSSNILHHHEFVNDDSIKPEELAQGITVFLDQPVQQESVVLFDSAGNVVRYKPVVRVVLDMPWPLVGEVETVPQDLESLPIGFRPVELDAELRAKDDLIVWAPTANTKDWLIGADTSFQLRQRLLRVNWGRPLVGRFIIDGWAIVGQDPKLHLNDHGNTVIEAGQTQLKLPTDDEVTGAQFLQWFQLDWQIVIG